MRIARYAVAIGVFGAAFLHPAHSFAQIEPVINWSPPNPEIGQSVLFTIEGVPIDIDKASWSMGGPGCDGADPTPECIPSLWTDCKAQTYKYASHGTRTVNLTIEVGGNVYSAPTATITIAPTGSCAGNPTIGFTWNPTVPEIGESVRFDIVGVTGDVKADWDFGGPGCDGESQLQTCNPLFSNCHSFSHTYSSSGDMTVSLTVTVDGSVIGTATNTVTVAPSGSCGGDTNCSNVLLEPGFEGGSGSAWSEDSSNGYFLITMNRPRSGSFSAWLGGIDDEASSVWQSPSIDPLATSALLSYWYWIESNDVCGHDQGGVTVNGLVARGHDLDLCLSTNTLGFVESDFVDLLPYAGTSPQIRFFATTDSAGVSSLYIDDVTLQVCVPGPPSDHVFSDGFESGNTSAWSITVS